MVIEFKNNDIVNPGNWGVKVGYIGEIKGFLDNNSHEREGFLPLDGRKVSRVSFPDFFSWAVNSGLNGLALVVDNDGITLPDVRGRFLVNKSDSIEIGSSGGEAAHTLTINEIPSQAHNNMPPYYTISYQIRVRYEVRPLIQITTAPPQSGGVEIKVFKNG